jgi:hypothetical protein
MFWTMGYAKYVKPKEKIFPDEHWIIRARSTDSHRTFDYQVRTTLRIDGIFSHVILLC